jgi:4-amino-4-deoxy-L-arabinose transferase and related glycosyltransferases of PMT family
MSTLVSETPPRATSWVGAARGVLALLVVAYLLPGLLAHEPWKPDEPYTLGVARAMLASGDWVVPMVGDLPFVEKPPLFYWAEAISIRAFPMLAAHDAARMACVFFILVAILATNAAARLCWGEERARVAALLFLCPLGLEGHAQRLQVDLALVAGFAIALLGFAAHIRHRRWAPIALGIGTGVGFLSKGLIAPGTIALTALLLPLFFTKWRTRAYAKDLMLACLVALPWVVSWPMALWLREPALFDEWFWANNVGRFLGYSTARLGATSEPFFWPQTLPWFLFPLWIYAAVALARGGQTLRANPGLQIGATMAAVMLLVLFASASGRAIYALPLFSPFVLMAVGASIPDSSRASRALGGAAIGIGFAAAIAAWWVWAMLLTTGSVPSWTRLPEHFPVPFEMEFHPGGFAAGMALTVGFAALVAMRKRLPQADLKLWVGALCVAWGLAMTLWLPWLDAAKSYRAVFEDMARHVPDGCVALRRLGESERAMVEYYTPLRATTVEASCDAILWTGHAVTGKHRPGPEWTSVWTGSRPGEKAEKFELFVRRPAQ